MSFLKLSFKIIHTILANYLHERKTECTKLKGTVFNDGHRNEDSATGGFERAGLWRKVKAEGKHESRKRNKYSEGKKHICNKLIRL